MLLCVRSRTPSDIRARRQTAPAFDEAEEVPSAQCQRHVEALAVLRSQQRQDGCTPHSTITGVMLCRGHTCGMLGGIACAPGR